MTLPNRRESIAVNAENMWRLETPGASGWTGSVKPGSPNKYYMISVDSHLSPPPTLFFDRIDKKYVDRLVRMEKRDGQLWLIQEGMSPVRIFENPLTGEDAARSKAGGGGGSLEYLEKAGPVGLERTQDQDADGVDGELIFPNGAAMRMWSSGDPEFSQAQCRIWNDWAWEVCGPYNRCNVTAAIAPADLEGSINEVYRVAKLGFRVLQLPNKPIFGPQNVSHVNYNLPHFDPLWSAIEETGMPITFHITTGEDPRSARGNGGAIINYAAHGLPTVFQPLVNMCSSGVFERFPRLKVATIEANAGWVPWLLDSMDEAARKHHMWARPKLKALPSEYYRANCASSFGEDRSAMLLVNEYKLENNFMWANDYPHQEGLWPHSAEAIERTMRNMDENTREKLLGLNAASFFNFQIPPKYQKSMRS